MVFLTSELVEKEVKSCKSHAASGESEADFEFGETCNVKNSSWGMKMVK